MNEILTTPSVKTVITYVVNGLCLPACAGLEDKERVEEFSKSHDLRIRHIRL